MRLHRLVTLAAAPLALAALLGSAAPAGACHDPNAVTQNGVAMNVDHTANALTVNALTTTGSALTDLDSVQVEAVDLPDTARSGSP